MRSPWVSLLTLSQALLAGAFPAFRFRQFLHFKGDCNEDLPNPPNGILTGSLLAADAAAQAEPATSSDLSSLLARQTSSGSTDQSSSLCTSAITFADPNLSLQTVTSTALPSSQRPTTTNATGSLPDTTGSVITTLETAGNPPVQPFPTSIPSVSESTLLPTNVTVLPISTAGPSSTLTETLTLPLTTFETIVTTQTVISVPVETTATVTAVTVVNTTVKSGGSEVATSIVLATVITTTGTAFSETTLQASSTETGTIATTVTATGPLSSIPVPSSGSSCLTMNCSGQDIFLPVAVGEPPANLQRRGGHPVPRLGINNATGPIETNKFYSNFFLGSQGFPTFAQPYSLTWSKGSGNAQSWGMAVSHVDDSQKVFGPLNNNIPNSPKSYYINPLGIQSMILSAAELRDQTVLTSDELFVMSGNIHLAPAAGSSSVITFPVVQGMGLVTALYTNLQPVVQSSVFFRSVAATDPPKAGVFKYKVTLEDGKVWLIYATPDNGLNPNFELKSSTLLRGMPSWSGEIQVAKLPNAASESVYDDAAGVYPTTGHIGGYAEGSSAQYSLSWNKGGPYANDATLLMFALPHHVQSFDDNTRSKIQNLTLDTTTKGVATAVASDYWVMQEQLPTDMGFAPWRPSGSQTVYTLSTAAIAAIQNVSAVEASQNMSQQSNLNSMYYSGKALSKFATLCYTMYDLADQKALALSALDELKSAFAVFAENRQEFPLLYDTDWKGLVSSASYVTGDPGVDFGNSYYNDHHFHYGYFIHAAAIIGYLDPSWLAQNKDYVNALVRDTSNPSSLDQFFPVFRSFDPYNGHSWAKGLYETGDGKDEESSSEDAMFAYALKMWGKTVGDPSMEARGNLMVAILARSLRNYFLMDSGNTNQPAAFIGNKVTGILFENKADHVTYFGINPEYIQGIHMIPIMPFSTLTRTQQFVAEEWATYFADGAVAQASEVQGGWRGILYSNLAIINPRAAYNFFTQANFDPSWLDGGATRTWYIAMSAMLGGA
jgi:endo-1,3(4)-beta-glucanase